RTAHAGICRSTHFFGPTVGGLGPGAVVLGYLRGRLAAFLYKGNYAVDCLASGNMRPAAGCLSAAADGLQMSMQLCALVLLIAVLHYVFAAKNLPLEANAS